MYQSMKLAHQSFIRMLVCFPESQPYLFRVYHNMVADTKAVMDLTKLICFSLSGSFLISTPVCLYYKLNCIPFKFICLVITLSTSKCDIFEDVFAHVISYNEVTLG